LDLFAGKNELPGVGFCSRPGTKSEWHTGRGGWESLCHGEQKKKLCELATELGVTTLKELGYESEAQFQQRKIKGAADVFLGW